MSRTVRVLCAALLSLASLAAMVWWLTRPAAPDPFYTPPSAVPAPPGTLLRQEPFIRKVPPQAQAWRLLYSTTRHDGTPALASAIVMAARLAPAGPRPLITWTHGTTGVAPGCAPSLLADPFANVPALQALLDQGWIYLATDYVGQGTPGPHPYLVGEGEARSALDAARAVRQMQGLNVADGTVVWGHSQGGHAALWTGALAAGYAPDVRLLGVAAVAPASDLPRLIDAVQHTTVGRIMSAYLLQAYSDIYPDVSFDAHVPGHLRWLAADMASRCLAGPQALVSVAESMLAGRSIFAVPPTSGPLGERLAQNVPLRSIHSPLFIAQGLRDDLVLPDIQARYAEQRCAAGQALQHQGYAGHDHLSIVAPDSPLTADLMRWTQDRFNQIPWAPKCP